MPILTTIKPQNPKACQKADWKRHKKVCGKEPEKDVLDGKDKQAYKDDLEV